MHKIYNKKLKQFRLNSRLSLLGSSTWALSIQLLTFPLYVGPDQYLTGLSNIWKHHLASKVSIN